MKPTHLFLLLSIILLSVRLSSQSSFWLRASESDGFYTSHSFHSMIEQDGAYYLAGEFWRDIVFDDFSASIADPEDVQDAFVLKMNKTGESLGFIHVGGSGYERISDLVISPSGELWLAGFFSETLRFGEMIYTANGFYDGFVLHLNANGELADFFQFEPNGSYDAINIDQIEIDGEGDLWLVLNFAGTITLGDQAFYAGFTQDALVVEMKSDGEILQTHHYASLAEEEVPLLYVNDLVVDANDQVLVGGVLADAVAIDGEPLEPYPTGTAFIQRWNPNGESDWLQEFPGGYSQVNTIAISDDQIMLGIQFQNFLEIFGGQIDGSGSFADMAIVALDEAGQFQWARGFVKAESEPMGGVYPIDMGYHDSQFYLGGMFSGTVESEGSTVLQTFNSQQAYLFTLDPNGELFEIQDFSSSGFSRIQASLPTEDGFCFAGEFASDLAFQDTSIVSPNSTLFYGLFQREGVTSTEEVSIFEWTISPNPAREWIQIEAPESTLTNVRMVLFNEQGQLVRSWSDWSLHQPLPLTGLPAGKYDIRCLKDGQLLGHARVIKH